jgi:hypothetical protein
MERNIHYGYWHISWNKDTPSQWVYPVADTLTYTVQSVNSVTLATPCRLNVFYVCQIGGEFVVIFGEEFIPDNTGTLTLDIQLPQKEAMDSYTYDLMLRTCDLLHDWFIVNAYGRADEIAQLGSGRLVVDRLRVHPVDWKSWSYQTAFLASWQLITLDLETTPDTTVHEILEQANDLKNRNKSLAIPGLIQALSHERKGVRDQALDVLHSMDTPEARAAVEKYQQRD